MEELNEIEVRMEQIQKETETADEERMTALEKEVADLEARKAELIEQRKKDIAEVINGGDKEIEKLEEESSKMYCHSFPSHSTDIVLRNVLPDLNAVAVFSINKDLKLVLEDHYPTVKFTSVASPVWSHLHQRSYTGIHNKLYGYFHDKKLEIISFSKKRFKFCNTFETSNVYDSVYFLLNTWNQLMMQTEQDELHLVGDIPEQETITEELKKYLKKVYIINPSADFNEAPATQIKNMPYDLMTLYVKGR